MRSAVHGICAAASGDGQRPTPMEQDSDNFKHKIEQLNLSAKRARADSNADRAALIACVDGLVAEASLLFKSGTTTANVQEGGRSVSLTTNHAQMRTRIRRGRRQTVVANIDQFGPTTSSVSEITVRERNFWISFQRNAHQRAGSG